VFLHPKDIPVMIAQGTVDAGFSGLDLIHETRSEVRPVIRIRRGYVRMALAVLEDSSIASPFHLMGKVVGSPFPRMTEEYFQRLKVDVGVQEIHGASEGMPYLGVVDAIMDVVETGRSLVANRLRIVDDDIFHSECVLMVGKPEYQKNYALLNQFLRTLYV
jgi:ATP phosphoribosyltransferase